MSKTALIVVDMQNDFADPKGSLFVKGAEQIVHGIAEEVDTYLNLGLPVYYTRDAHPNKTPHFDTWPVHCVEGTWGANLIDELEFLSYRAIEVKKGMGQDDGFSGFDDTELHYALEANGVTDLEVVGLAGDFCVKSTAIDGAKLGFKVTLPLSLTRFVNSANAQATIMDFDEAGVKVIV